MILIISTSSAKLSENEFVNPIKNIVKEKAIIKHYTDINKDDLINFDKIIICGTALKDNEYLDHIKKFKWIENYDKPLLGICSGMQIIGLSFGAKLIANKEIGMEKIKVLKKNKLFSKDFEAYELHNNSLTELFEFEILAESGNSVQAITHKEKDIYGIIFHPEVRNENIILNFVNL